MTTRQCTDSAETLSKEKLLIFRLIVVQSRPEIAQKNGHVAEYSLCMTQSRIFRAFCLLYFDLFVAK